MSSTKDDPQGTPLLIPFDQGINLDQVNQNILPADGSGGPHLTNTGILRDDGVTNLYETEIVDAYDQVLFAPNGKKIQLQYSTQGAFIDGNRVATIGSYGLADRDNLPFGAIDAAMTSTGTTLLLTRGTSLIESKAFVTTSAPGGNWQSVAYGNGIWVAVASTTSTTTGIARSTDGGATWSFVTTSAPGGPWASVAYGNGVWVAMATTSSTTAGIARSVNGGVTWSFVTTSAPSGNWASVSYGNGVWIAQSLGTSVTTSLARSTDDGATWSFITTPAHPGTWDSSAYGNGVWLAITQFNSAATSLFRSTDDGLTWAAVTLPQTLPANWTSIAYGNGVWVALLNGSGTNDGILRSTDDGLTWSFVTTSAPGGAWRSVSSGGGVWYATAASTSTTLGIAKSIDGGISWAFITTSAPAGDWGPDLEYGNGVWIFLSLTTSTTAGVFRIFTAPFVTYYVLEYNGTSVINTTTLTTNQTNVTNYACLVKTHAMTFASVQVAYIYFTAPTTVTAAVFVSGTSNTAFTGTGLPNFFRAISAFSNGGTTIIGGIPDTTTTGPRSYYNSVPGNYGAWTAVSQASYLSTYEDFNMLLGGTLNLMATTSSLASANQNVFGTKIVISTAGAVTVTTTTVAGLVIIPTDSYTGFNFSSGRYKSTAATQFSGYIFDSTSVVRKDQTVTAYAKKPESAGSIGNTAGSKAFIYAISGQPSQVCWGGVSGVMPISEYGDVAFIRPVDQWTDGTNFYVMWLSVTGPMVKATISPAGSTGVYKVFPISRDVVALNDSYGTIINTIDGLSEVNQGGHCPAFISDIYLTGTNQSAYQTVANYSNAVDVGSGIASYAGLTTGMSSSTISGAVQYPVVFYQSTSGTLFAFAMFAGGTQTATDTTIAYVQNTNIPAPVDARYAGGGVELLNGSALQTTNESDADGFSQYYAGYTLANQYPVSYQFFNLFGQLYGFDGTKIFRMPINGATAGTPEQVALTTGLVFITNSATTAWFWSSFDNTLFAFTGGASVDHWKAMTGVGLVSSGIFNVRENALYLQLADATTLIFRDGLPQLFTSAFPAQTTYSTDLGVYFVSTSSPNTSKTWTYYAGSGTPITLTWQSGYYGFGRNRYCRMTQVVFAFKVADPVTTDITINYKALTDEAEISETATFTGGTYVVSPAGYVRIQYNPTQDFTYGFSVGIQCTKKVTLYEVTAYYTDGGVAPAQNRLP